MLKAALPSPFTDRGPSSNKEKVSGKEALYLIVRGDFDKNTLKAKIKQQGIPWSIKTDLQKVQRRLRVCKANKDEKGADECNLEIKKMLDEARLESKAAQEDTKYIITGVRASEVVNEEKAVVKYEGKHPEIVMPLMEMGPSADKAIDFCQRVDGMSITELWSYAKIPLDMDVFLDLLRLVGIPNDKAVEFLHQVILIFIANWRDKGAAFEAALALFPDRKPASAASSSSSSSASCE